MIHVGVQDTHTHTHTLLLLLLGVSRYYQFPATTTGGPPKQTTASESHPETRRFPRRGQPTGAARPPKWTMHSDHTHTCLRAVA